MKQILLVLRKDCRRFWLEIALSLAITCAFIWLTPYLWTSPALGHRFNPSALAVWLHLDWQHVQFLAYAIEVLLPVSWLILMARVVHDENLVGNRQFWLTRPYLWHLLLAEKVLFVFLFIGVPFVTAQVCLLMLAGIHPTANIPNLTASIILIVGAVVLPLFALATVTSSLLRMIATLLGIVAILLVIAFIASNVSSSPSVSIPYADRITIPLIFAFCGTVLVAQYSARKLWLSRFLLVVLGITVGILAMHPFALSLLERIYDFPGPGQPDPIEISKPGGEDLTAFTTNGRSVGLSIPIEISGLPGNDVLVPDDVRITIDAADGSQWTSPWQPIYRHHFSPDAPTGDVAVDVDSAFFNRIRKTPVTIHLALAFTQIQQGDPSTIIFDPRQDFTVPHVGTCTYTDRNSFRDGAISCRAAFHEPALAKITFQRSPSPCDATYPDQPGAHPDTVWLDGPLHTELAELNFSPIETAQIAVPNYQQRGNDGSPGQLALCPGAPITITPFRLVRRFQYQLDLPGTQLPPQ